MLPSGRGGRAGVPGQLCLRGGPAGCVENQAFPPPEGAPEDSPATGRRPRHLPVALASAPRGHAGEQSSVFVGAGAGPGERRDLRRPERANKRKTISLVPHQSQQEDRVRRRGCPGTGPAPGSRWPRWRRAGGRGWPGTGREPLSLAPRRAGTHCDTWVMGASSVSPSRSRSSVKLLVLRKWGTLTSSRVGLFLTAGGQCGPHVSLYGQLNGTGPRGHTPPPGRGTDCPTHDTRWVWSGSCGPGGSG